MEPTPSRGKRVAFFGGSFDPPHEGHLAVGRAARAALALDEVLFAPVGAQPLKPEGSTAGFEDRVAMTGLAIADEPGFLVSLADAPAGPPQRTPNLARSTRCCICGLGAGAGRRAFLPDGGGLVSGFAAVAALERRRFRLWLR